MEIRKFFCLLAGLFALTLTHSARAGPLEDTMRADLEWIATHSGYTFNEPIRLPFYVAYVDERTLQIIFYGQETVSRIEATPNTRLPEILGEYYPETESLYLLKDFDLNNPEHQTTLLHEMVHHAQKMAGKFKEEYASCPAQSERDAYHLTNDWIKETGNPTEPMPEMMIQRMSICRWQTPHM